MQTRRGLVMVAMAAALCAGVVRISGAETDKAPPTSLPPTAVAPQEPSAATPAVDLRTAALLKQVKAATRAAKTLTADFSYTVTSVKIQHSVTGSFKLMKPNLARVSYSYMAQPAFPNLIAADGKNIYTFTPASFRTSDHTFADMPFDSRLGAAQASGRVKGGGAISADADSADGADIHLWDAMPLQAFFDPMHAIQRYLFIADPSTLEYEGETTISGVTYRVLHHHFAQGSTEGAEPSDFEQRLYIGPDNLIHLYVLEFRSCGRPGIEIMRLSNIRVNAPLRAKDFAFTPPQK